MALRHSYDRGDIVLVQFPFSDALRAKKRPAIVLSTKIYHDDLDEILLIAITSRPPRILRATDYELQDWSTSGLTQPSWVRSHVATVHWKLIVSYLGKLSSRDLLGVEQSLRVATGM